MEVCDKMKKNLVVGFIGLVLILNLIFIVSQSSGGFTLNTDNINSVMSGLVCASTPIACVEGKIVGVLKDEIINSIAKTDPKLANVITTMNQVKGFVNQGSQIVD